MKFLLDTDTVSYALRGQGGVGSKILSLKPSQLAVSSITVAELRYGAERKASQRLHALVSNFLSGVEVVDFDNDAAAIFGRIASLLAERGSPIGDFDVLIAAHAISLKRVLVTNNTKHFSRVPGLKIENWNDAK
ncbi:MAG: type II toxin-antitoxin system VapC family toxin [Myxococcales bacterium]|nr:type II toxin-antitoxin system VapC family toxin [Myxococcales bacterium]